MAQPKKHAFFFHYNKPASLLAGKTLCSFHVWGTCNLVEGIICKVPTYSRIWKISPKFVMAGRADNILIQDGIVTCS